MNTQSIAARFGCTPEQVRAQFAKNAASLSAMADKAARTGGRVGGYTSVQLRAFAAMALKRSL